MILAISNSAVLSARNALTRNQTQQGRVLQRLATGKKINAGRDDPAGLISSEQLAAEIRALEAETKSLSRVHSNATIVDGNVGQVSEMLGDINALVVASANQAGMSDEEIAANQMQIDSAVAGIERVTGQSISSLEGINIPNGGNAAVEAKLNSALAAVSSLKTGGANSLTSGNFEDAQTAIRGAITDVAVSRGVVGAYQKYTVESRINSNNVTIENLTASRSRIVDTDYAVETSNLIRSEILTTANIKTLKIAGQQGAHVLALLK
ncbi:MAG: hypothetical protein JSU63_16130 [Phycisphaerales bacterium]|nr:MAG: hypothetical protein JSU63_16130 [Phycisphaerales bacterium]